LTGPDPAPYPRAVRWVMALAVGWVVLGQRDADAGGRRFAWLWDTDTLPERTVDLEWWASEETDSNAILTIATVVGITDTLELAVPLEITWRARSDATDFSSYGLELRWRLASADAAKAGPFVPFVRFAVRREIQLDAASLEGEIAATYDLTPDLRGVVDVGITGLTRIDEVYATGGLGLSYALTQELKVGFELYAWQTVASNGPGETWVSLGPNLSFSHGRFWITAALPIGLNSSAPDFLPRVIWGTAL
jgi:hypothetical protein